MKRRLNIVMLMLLLASLIHSCIHDEIYSESNISSKEYQSKSLWKEDETYIKNVMYIYKENEEKIKKVSGNPLWDYAMTMDRFDESFLMVPVVERGKVIAVLNVPRKGKRVYFTYTHVENDIEFFQNLISSRIKKAVNTLKDNTTAKIVCTTKTISVFNPDDESNPNGPGHWESHSVTECKRQELENCLGEVLPDGTCLGGGTEDPGYPYPGGGGDENPQPEQEDPCEKLKAQNNITFRNKVLELDKTEVFTKTKETGFANAYGNTPYDALQNIENGNVKLPVGNKYFGFMHTHLDKAGVIKIFSPGDVATFLTSCVRNAQQVGNMTDAYAMVITSQGNYILKYSGDGSYSIGPNQINNWQTWYETEYSNLKEIELSNSDIVEKIFTQFLQEKVNIAELEVYKMDKATGNASKLQYNGLNNPVQPIPCP